MLELSNRHNLSISSMKKRMKGCFIDKKAEQAFSESMASKLSIKMGGLDLPVSSPVSYTHLILKSHMTESRELYRKWGCIWAWRAFSSEFLSFFCSS